MAGTMRDKIIAGSRSINPNGNSPEKNVISKDQQKVAGTTPTTRDLAQGRSTLRPESTDIDFRDKFRKSEQFGQKEDITKPSTGMKITGGTDVTKVQAVGKSPKGKDAGALKRTVTPFEALEKGGQSKLMQARLNRFSKAGSGSGNFTIASQTRAQESRLGSGGAASGGVHRGGKAPSIFSAKGMESFFGNMGNLANKILSPEYQKQVKDARTAATNKAGQRADIKAKTDRMKAYGSMIKDLSDSGGNEDVIKMLENKITTEGAEENIDPMAKFASQLAEMGLPREQISQIAGIIEGGATR
jgi:hypothetical protein